MLALAIQRSLETAVVLERAKVATEGSIIANNMMFTPERKDKISPAYV